MTAMPRLAVTLIHGVETADSGYGDRAGDLLRRAFAKHSGVDPDEALVVRPTFWAPVLQSAEDELFQRCFGPGQARYVRWLKRQTSRVDHGSRLAMLTLSSSALLPRVPFAGPLPWPTLRWVTTEFAGDAIAYQVAGERDHTVYDAIHARVAVALRELADVAGPDAPLCVLGHSLGSVIASNYFYDLQVEHGHYPRGGPLATQGALTGPGRVPPQPRGAAGEPLPPRRLVPAATRLAMGSSPLERGETLTDLITLGSPLGLYSLRSRGFHRPLLVPAPSEAGLLDGAGDLPAGRRRGDPTGRSRAGGWINIYSPYDLVSQPLRSLSEEYRLAVREDIRVNVGPWWAARGPLSHVWYWNDPRVAELAGRALARTWRALAGIPDGAPAPRATRRPAVRSSDHLASSRTVDGRSASRQAANGAIAGQLSARAPVGPVATVSPVKSTPSRSVSARSVSARSGSATSGSAKSVSARSGSATSASAKSGSAKSAVWKSGSGEPTVWKAGPSKPGSAKSAAARPGPAKTGSSGPWSATSAPVKPAPPKPAPPKPAPPKPAPPKPGGAKPGPSRPAPGKGGASKPASAGPESARSELSKAGTSTPGPSKTDTARRETATAGTTRSVSAKAGPAKLGFSTGGSEKAASAKPGAAASDGSVRSAAATTEPMGETASRASGSGQPAAPRRITKDAH
jgi:hypothetical protein